jgi:defect-in-organelle-trafficking protein DotB
VFDKVQTISCEIDQTSVPEDVSTFAEGVRNALRRDPDIIMVGESRDAETIKAAVLAAQTGHTVYSTAHSNNVSTTFLRLIQSLPVEEMQSIMGSVIDSVRTIISQRLVSSVDGKRCAVREYLVFNAAIRKELLSVAAANVALLPAKAADLVERHGRSMLRHAEDLAAMGRIDPAYVDLVRRDSAPANKAGG